jgi:hypothetical protein
VRRRAPSANEVLKWLLVVADAACLDVPARLFDRAVTEGLIDFAGRDPFARRIIGLIAEATFAVTCSTLIRQPPSSHCR